MTKNPEFDVDAIFGNAGPTPDSDYEQNVAIIIDRQIAREIAQQTKVTTLLIMGDLSGPECLPLRCEKMCPSFRLISMRQNGPSKIALFSVPVESEMAELFEEIDGRRGLQAIAYDAQGRPKEAYII